MDDRDIIQLYLDRDEQAISLTAQKYGSYCSAIARNILPDSQDIEECISDAYLQLWSSVPPNIPDDLAAYLGKIVRNLAFNRYKHNTADKRGGGELPAVLDELAFLVSGRDEPEQEVIGRELAAAIDGFLDTLPPQKRAIMVRRYWYSDSVGDIAKRYKMREGAVSMTLNRLRLKLRDYLTERGFEL
ncbi:MAG: sigma-70 family RNA polymerase sigma factor [Clostridia bacterium]|nr:sigma-70 family RNA polymerase sigma factor [Clostridia bacterium]MBR5903429.1 sigma-70 family RNA polymerase sigma factor [Clostridia bacterium]